MVNELYASAHPMRKRLRALYFIVACGLAIGCNVRPATPSAGNITFFVPGAAGDGPYYDALLDECAKDRRHVRVLNWGMPKPLCFMNFSSRSVHDAAEAKLAAALSGRLAADPGATIDLIGHSAGCGVILGALARLPNGLAVGRVILLAPSVSPGYDVAPAVARAGGGIDVLTSVNDTTFLEWRCGRFGTYDRIKTSAAGFGGFAAKDDRLREYVWTVDDREIGNDGGHYGALARVFVRLVVLSK